MVEEEGKEQFWLDGTEVYANDMGIRMFGGNVEGPDPSSFSLSVLRCTKRIYMMAHQCRNQGPWHPWEEAKRTGLPSAPTIEYGGPYPIALARPREVPLEDASRLHWVGNTYLIIGKSIPPFCVSVVSAALWWSDVLNSRCKGVG